MAYADNVQQPGLLSAFAILTEQNAGGTLTPGSGNFATVGTPAGSLGSTTSTEALEWLDIETFTVTDDPAIIQFDVMQKARDTLQSTRSGVHKVMAQTTLPFYGLMGAQLWKIALGNDTYVTGAAITATTGNVPVGSVQLTGVTMPTLPAGLSTDWAGTWITLDPGTNEQENVLIEAQSGTTLTITATKNPHGSTYSFLTPPPVPTLATATTGGTVLTGTYGVEFTYTNAQGETTPGPSASIFVPSTTATNVITAPSPPAEGSATTYTAYVTAANGQVYHKQGSAINIGTGFSLTAPPATVTLPPIANTAADPAAGMSISQPAQHVISTNAGAAQPTLPTVFSIAQFANLYEWQVPFGYISKIGLTGDTKTIKMDANFSFQNIPLDPVAAGFLGTITPYVNTPAEAGDSPFIMRDGGVVAPYSTNVSDPAGGGLPVARNRLLSLNFEVDNGLIAREYGGGVQNAEVYVPGVRKPSIKFREDAGQYSVGPAMHTNYVKTQASIATYLAFQNPLAGTAWGAHFPKCQVIKYDPITAMADPLAFDGEFLPLRDPTRGYMVRISIINGAAYPY